MNQSVKKRFLWMTTASTLFWFSAAHADIITSQFGVSAPGGTGSLTDLTGTSCCGADGWISNSSITWTHMYDASNIASINSASVEFDLLDADSGSLTLDHNGTLVGIADPAGSSSTGGPGPWHEYHPADAGHALFTFNLGPAFFADLATGSFSFTGTDNSMGVYGINRAVLEIDYDPVNVPGPASLSLFALGLVALRYRSRKDS